MHTGKDTHTLSKNNKKLRRTLVISLLKPIASDVPLPREVISVWPCGAARHHCYLPGHPSINHSSPALCTTSLPATSGAAAISCLPLSLAWVHAAPTCGLSFPHPQPNCSGLPFGASSDNISSKEPFPTPLAASKTSCIFLSQHSMIYQ